MADLLDGNVYASIMATLATLQDECLHKDDCRDCPFYDVNRCLLKYCPERYDLDKISEALKKDGDNK